MNKEELSKWLLNKLNSCYPIIQNDNENIIYWIYDKQYIRKEKLNKLNNQDIIQPKIKGCCLFEQDMTNKYLYCDYFHIWEFISNNSEISPYCTSSIIKSILKENIKLKEYIPAQKIFIINFTEKEYLTLYKKFYE